MAREELSINVTAKDDASKVLDQVGKKVDKLEGQKAEIKVGADTDQAERDIQGLLEKVDKLGAGQAANLLLTTNASQITSEIADLVIKLDTLDASDPTVDVTVANIGQLQGDLDQISAKAKEINDTPIKLDTSGATQGIDQIGKSADSSKSVLANMVGNATQDLGALGGIAGSAGVAIGQMGEYMVDAANSGDKIGDVLKNFGAVAGPIAGIAAAIQFVSAAMGAYKEMAAEAEARTTALADAMAAGGTAADYADMLRENVDALGEFNAASSEMFGELGVWADKAVNAIPLLGEAFGDAGEDIIDISDRAGLSIYELGSIIEGGGKITGNFKKQLDAARESGKITGGEYDALSEAMSKYGESMEEAARQAGLFAVDQAEANAMLQELGQQTDPLKAFATDFQTLMSDIKDGAVDTDAATAAINRLSTELGIPPSEVIAMGLEEIGRLTDVNNEKMDAHRAKLKEQATAYQLASAGLAQAIDDADAFAAALDRVNEASELDKSQMMLDTVDSFDAMKEAIEGTKDAAVDWATVDLTPDSVEELKGIPDELAAVTAGISGMRDTIQTELSAAFETGGIDAYTEKAEFFRAQVLDQFPASFEAMGASAGDAQAQAAALAAELGLMPEDIQIMIELTREEEARAALDAFSSVIGQMPTEVQVAINTAIAQGDIEGALAILNEQLINRGYDPIILPVDADIAAAEGKVDQVITFADGSTGVVTIDGNPDPATGKVGGVVTFIDGSTGTVTIEGDPNPATGKVDGVITYADGSTGTVVVDADTGAAEGEIANLTKTRNMTVNVHYRGIGAPPTGGQGISPNPDMATMATATAVAPYAVPAPAASLPPIYINLPAPQPTNVTVQAGVIGNRFNVDRTVTRALRRHQRLNGVRA